MHASIPQPIPEGKLRMPTLRRPRFFPEEDFLDAPPFFAILTFCADPRANPSSHAIFTRREVRKS